MFDAKKEKNKIVNFIRDYYKDNNLGGVVIGISDQFKIPVKYIGLGEGMEDLQVFRRKEFVDSLFGEKLWKKTP